MATVHGGPARHDDRCNSGRRRWPVIGKRVLAVLHPGAMGAAVAACLVGRGHEVGWLRTGRSEATLRRAEQAGFSPFDDLAELLAHADIVFSIWPPARGARRCPTVGGLPRDRGGRQRH
jgi:phosphoglycerate dehydrogenase-like enzyme